MGTFTGQKPKNTYDSILHVASNDQLTGSLQYIQDGYGNNTTVRISLNEVELTNVSLSGTLILSSPLAVSNGGLGVALSDPNADRILFWDDSDGQHKYLTVGSNLSITGTTLDASVLGGGLSWHEETSTSYTASANEAVITNNSSLVTVTLPTTAAVGDIVQIVGKGSGLWRIAQNSGQKIHFGNITTTTGASGYIDALQRRDSITLVTTVANTDFTVVHAVGCVEMI